MSYNSKWVPQYEDMYYISITKINNVETLENISCNNNTYQDLQT